MCSLIESLALEIMWEPVAVNMDSQIMNCRLTIGKHDIQASLPRHWVQTLSLVQPNHAGDTWLVAHH